MADQEVSLNDQMIARRDKMAEMCEAGMDPFGHRFERSHTAAELHELYDNATAEDLEEQAIEACLVRLIGWEGIEEAGKPVAFSKEAARDKLLKEDWVRQQILDEAADVSNFTPKALKP